MVPEPSLHNIRILFLTLEYTAGTFSGNGIYAKSQVRALSGLGAPVLVISARPSHLEGKQQELVGGEQLLEVPVSSWGKLDADAPWEEYAAGCRAGPLVEEVRRFRPTVVLGVDWTSLRPYQAIAEGLGPTPPPYVYLNYRVFSRTAEGPALELVSRLEREAVEAALDTVVLCRSDALYISQHLQPPSKAQIPPKVLLPALRADIAATSPPTSLSTHHPQSHPTPTQPPLEHTNAATCPSSGQASGGPHPHPSPAPSSITAAAWLQGRHRLTCCVRMSPEKEPHRFVEVVEELARRGALQRWGLTPLMCGAMTGEYAQALKRRLLEACPEAEVHEEFLGPLQLAALYGGTRLNLHPCSYDAYGMTLVEAASQGAPSIANAGGSVGATDLLRGDAGEVVLANFSQGVPALADAIEQLMADSDRLVGVAVAGMAKARSWDEPSNARHLLQLVQAAMEASASN